jgi:uncharacterized oxidoreductase
MKISNKKILITGGGSGIGLAMAERFILDNNTVIICGRRSEVLEEVKQKFPSILTKVCDLENPEDRNELFSWVQQNHNDLQILVNNAGIQNWMSIDDDDFYQNTEKEVAINILAPVHLSSLFLNLDSLETIMNVTSGLAFVPLTKTPVYSATKAFFHSYTISLRHLCQSKNIAVIEIIPPALNTDLGGKGIHDFAPPVSGFIDSIFSQMDEGKIDLTYGFTEQISKAGQEVFGNAFKNINP